MGIPNFTKLFFNPLPSLPWDTLRSVRDTPKKIPKFGAKSRGKKKKLGEKSPENGGKNHEKCGKNNGKITGKNYNIGRKKCPKNGEEMGEKLEKTGKIPKTAKIGEINTEKVGKNTKKWGKNAQKWSSIGFNTGVLQELSPGFYRS